MVNVQQGSVPRIGIERFFPVRGCVLYRDGMRHVYCTFSALDFPCPLSTSPPKRLSAPRDWLLSLLLVIIRGKLAMVHQVRFDTPPQSPPTPVLGGLQQGHDSPNDQNPPTPNATEPICQASGGYRTY
jgi:hypothetical protein